MFKFPPNFEDDLTELVVGAFTGIPESSFHEPESFTNPIERSVTHKIIDLAKDAGCPGHKAAPYICFTWTPGRPSTYEALVIFNYVEGDPRFEIPILPSDRVLDFTKRVA